jgi:ATP-binding cassette subfamily B protein
MSGQAPAKLKETERIQMGPGPGRGPFGGGMVGQKASTFVPSVRRLLVRMRPDRFKAYAVIVLTVLSVLATAIGPMLLGRATDVIFTGLIGGRLPAGQTKAEAISQLRSDGQDKVADMVSSMAVVPGRGVDFAAVGPIVMIVIAIYLAASVVCFLSG